MSALVEHLTAPEVRPRVIATCVDVIEREVASKRGLSGTALKASYKVVKALKPDMVQRVVDKLLPEFAAAMQPLWDEADGTPKNQAFSRHLNEHRGKTAEALLTVTDQRAHKSTNATLKKTYDKLRGNAKEHVEEAVPSLAQALEPYLPA